ncbi:MAG TPA: porin [Limnobacter sp.]|uniref:porin n=1 Tax=Limnobacter sp. TaxID=2003368 RepID=UPI002ED955BE
MNKKLVAAALGLAFAAPVFADDSNVTVYGRVHQAWEHNTTRSTNVPEVGNTTNIANYSSRLGVRGQEDLGGGLKAIFAYEFGVVTDAVAGQTSATAAGASTSPSVSTRHAYVGMKGAFGTLVVGSQDGGNDSQAPLYNQASNYLLNVNNNAGQLAVVGGNVAQGTGVVTGFQDAAIKRVQRVGNAVGYATNVAGVSITSRLALTGADAGAGNTGPSVETASREVSVAADYTLGALTFGAGYSRNDGTNSDAALKLAGGVKSQSQIGAKYDFGVAQVAGLIGRNTYYGNRDSGTEYAVSGLIPLAPNYGLQALYARADNASAFNTGNANDFQDTQYQLSAYYDFSKRTRTYVGYNRIKNEATTAANVERKDSSLVLGLRHNF